MSPGQQTHTYKVALKRNESGTSLLVTGYLNPSTSPAQIEAQIKESPTEQVSKKTGVVATPPVSARGKGGGRARSFRLA